MDVRYFYDADNNLACKVIGGVNTIYVGNHWERNMTTGIMTQYYYHAGRRIAMRVGTTVTSTVTFLHGDHLGSASVETNDSYGVKLAEMRYSPWGETYYQSNVLSTDKQFTGQRQEAGFGVYDYGARMYSPLFGRFLSADSVVPGAGNPQSLNRYAYVLNNPLALIDPSGHDPCATYDGSGNCQQRYEGLPDSRILVTRQGAIIDTEHAEKTNVISQVRKATLTKGGGTVVQNGSLDGSLFEITYHVAEGLTEDQILGTAFGIFSDYQHRWEIAQGEESLQHRIGSSYSLEDLPSDYLGFIQEATGLSLEEIANHYLGGIRWTMSSEDWTFYRATWGFPKNREFRAQGIGLSGNIHYDWPATLPSIEPIPSDRGAWNVLTVHRE